MDIKEAVEAIRAKELQKAYNLLVRIVEQDPKNAQAWYLLSFLVKKKVYQINCLHRALKFAPDHHDAKERLQKLESSEINSTTSAIATEEQQLSASLPGESSTENTTKPNNAAVKPSLDVLVEQWFHVLNYREQKVLEYLYFDRNNFSVNAVGRIISESTQKVQDMRQRALKKLHEPDAYAVAKPLMEWFSVYAQRQKSHKISEIDTAFQEQWVIGKATPLGVFRLLSALQAEGNTNKKSTRTQQIKAVVDSSPKRGSEIAAASTSTKLETENVPKIKQAQPDSPKGKEAFAILHDDHTPLVALKLSKRAYKALYRGGIRTIGELASLSDKKLWRVRGVGQTTVTEIHSCLKQHISEHPTPPQLSQEPTEKASAEQNRRPEPFLAADPIPIDVLGLSKRAYNVLMRANIKTIQELSLLSGQEIKFLRNAGWRTSKEIQTKLSSFFAQDARSKQASKAPDSLNKPPVKTKESEKVNPQLLHTPGTAPRKREVDFHHLFGGQLAQMAEEFDAQDGNGK